jgi:homoserine O-succinyltransferase/O-acetyltransferase
MTYRTIHVGLVNNMPDSALGATERQFRTVLSEAAEESGVEVCLSLFSLPEVPRSDATRRRMGNYAGIGALWDNHLDGLIVTGAEPRASNLSDEPYWTSLVQVIDWAEHNTYSSVWTCLAAHAAVLSKDGIQRRLLSDKHCGVFECTNVADHFLTAGFPARLWMPHSRWNDLPEEELSACGYRILTRSMAVGVDAFVKQGKNLSVFFQGHPEYEAGSLLLEYQRDIRRFLQREAAGYPCMPQGYFDEETAASMNVLQARALADRNSSISTRVATVKSTWRPAAVRFYRNWLRFLAEQKDKRQPVSRATAMAESGLKERRDGTF